MFDVYRKTVCVFLMVILIANVTICLIYNVPLRNSSILLIVAILLLIKVKNKINWFALVGFCLYGVYDVLYIGRISSNVLIMDFLYPVQILVEEEFDISRLRWFVGIFPLLFYLQLLVFFITKPFRKEYGLVSEN